MLCPSSSHQSHENRFSLRAIELRVTNTVGRFMARCEINSIAGVCTTRAERLVEEKWADLGPGPALISAFGAELLLAISDAEPVADAIGFMVRYDHPPLPVMSSSRLWARACPGGRPRAIVAPLDPSAFRPSALRISDDRRPQAWPLRK
jgi:hypothetical protein